MAIAYNQALVSLIDLERMQPSTDILLLISDLDFVSIPTKKTSKTKLLLSAKSLIIKKVFHAGNGAREPSIGFMRWSKQTCSRACRQGSHEDLPQEERDITYASTKLIPFETEVVQFSFQRRRRTNSSLRPR